jgi:hypothetical protein
MSEHARERSEQIQILSFAKSDDDGGSPVRDARAADNTESTQEITAILPCDGAVSR